MSAATTQHLEALISEKRSHKMTAKEYEAQFVNFVIGNAPEGHNTDRKTVLKAIKGL